MAQLCQMLSQNRLRALTSYSHRRLLECIFTIHTTSRLGKNHTKQQLHDHFVQFVSSLSECDYQVWTDGSYNPTEAIAGAAAIMHYQERLLISQTSCLPSSSTWSEYIGVWLGLDLLSAQVPGSARFFVDSLSVLKGLTNDTSTLPAFLVQALHVIIDMGFSCEFLHVPSHVGIQQNEYVDSLAIASSVMPVPPTPHPGALRPASEFVKSAAKKAREEFFEHLITADGVGTTTQTYLAAVRPFPPMSWKMLQQYPRWFQRLLVQMRVGVSPFFRSYLKKKLVVWLNTDVITVMCPTPWSIS